MSELIIDVLQAFHRALKVRFSKNIAVKNIYMNIENFLVMHLQCSGTMPHAWVVASASLHPLIWHLQCQHLMSALYFLIVLINVISTGSSLRVGC